MKRRRATSRGTILVVALGILAILAVIGATMIKVARVDNLSSQSFKRNADLNFAMESAIAWVENRLVSDYWTKMDGRVYYDGYNRKLLTGTNIWLGGAYDNPNDPRVPIAMMTLDKTGSLKGTTDVTSLGLYKTSERDVTKTGGPAIYCDAGYAARPNRLNNLPLAAAMPQPGKAIAGPGGNHLFDSGWMYDFDNTPTVAGSKDQLMMVASDNRLVQISVTVLDLGARWNINFHGSTTKDPASGCGQSYADDGADLTQVTPAWRSSGGDLPYNPTDAFEAQIGTTGTAPANPSVLNRWWGYTRNTAGTVVFDPLPQYEDRQMNQFDPSNKAYAATALAPTPQTRGASDLPLTAEDAFEILHPFGTPVATRMERAFPNSYQRGLQEATTDAKSYYRQFVTPYSYVASTRRRAAVVTNSADDEPLSGLYVKADLNNGPDDDTTSEAALKKNPLRMALLAANIGTSSPYTAYPAANTKLVDQIVANIIDFRDLDCRPTVFTVTSGSVTYTVAGVDAHPYITEVFIDIEHQRPSPVDNTKIIVPVYVELANPYEVELGTGNGAYARLTYGTSRTVIPGLPATIAKGGPTSTKLTGTAVKFEVTVSNVAQLTGAVFPVELFASSSAGTDVVTDRFPKPTTPATPTVGKSWQRLNVSGKDREGTLTTYFGGWDGRVEEAAQTCMVSASQAANFTVNAVKDGKIARPVENRSLLPDSKTARVRYKSDDMPFRRVGDLARVLRIGHPLASDATTVQTVSEQLGTKTDVLATTGPSGAAENAALVRALFLDLTADSFARATNFVTVNSPYFDRRDNDGDAGDSTDANVGATYAKDEFDTGNGTSDSLGPEIYEPGRINIKTATPSVIRCLLPRQLANPARGTGQFTEDGIYALADDICQFSQMVTYNKPAYAETKIKLPVDILKLQFPSAGNKYGGQLFLGDGCDDDGNGAVDDQAEGTWLYGYMSNFAATRSDSFVIYGTVRIVADRQLNATTKMWEGKGKVEGLRRFMAVIDRVPAAAYSPYKKWPDVSTTTSKGVGDPNSKYQGCRRVFATWID